MSFVQIQWEEEVSAGIFCIVNLSTQWCAYSEVSTKLFPGICSHTRYDLKKKLNSSENILVYKNKHSYSTYLVLISREKKKIYICASKISKKKWQGS